MIRSALVQIKGYSFYLDDVVLVTPINNSPYKDDFCILLRNNIWLRIYNEGSVLCVDSSFKLLYDMLYNRRIVTSTPTKEHIEIKDLDMSGISINIIYK